MKILPKAFAALTAALCLAITASASDWGDEAILEYAEYCKTHSYEQQIAIYPEMFQADDGGGMTSFFTEEEFRRIQNGENAIITIRYELWNEWFSWVDEPNYAASFSFFLNNGKEAHSIHCITDRSIFTVKELLRGAGIEDQAENIFFASLDAPGEYISGYVFKGYTFLPCENGWNEIDGERYYVKKDGTLATSSLTIGGIRYKFGKDGVCGGKYTGFTKSSKGKRYREDGILLKNEWFEAKNGRKYYADKDGYLTEILPYDPVVHESCEVSCEERIDFEEAVSQSYALVRARCIGLTEYQNGGRRAYSFLLNKTLYGEELPSRFELDIRDKEYTVESASGSYNYSEECIYYREGAEYLLPITKDFYSGLYYSTANAVIELGEDGVFINPTIQGRSLDEPDRIEQVKELLPAAPKTISYKKPDPDTLDEIGEIKVDFDKAVSMSYSLVRARCVGLTEQTNEKRVYLFALNRIARGGNMPDHFYVTVTEGDYGVEDAPGYTSADIHYKENTEYLLPLTKSRSVFYETDRYYSVGDAVIRLGKNGVFKKPTVQGRSIDGITRYDQLQRYLDEKNLSCGQTEDETGTAFTRSDDLAEVVRSSAYILDVNISDIFYDSAEDRTTYTCTVNEAIKTGNGKVTTVYAALPKDGAQLGGRYILLLNRSSDTSYVYPVSSLTHSVHPADSPTADKIRALVTESLS